MSQNNDDPRDFHVVKNKLDRDVLMNEEPNNFDEETAMEYAAPIEGDRDVPYARRGGEEKTGERGVGISALIFSIVSLFFWPFLLGAVGIILGIMAVNRDHKALGYTAIVIGAISIIVSLFGAPLITY